MLHVKAEPSVHACSRRMGSCMLLMHAAIYALVMLLKPTCQVHVQYMSVRESVKNSHIYPYCNRCLSRDSFGVVLGIRPGHHEGR